MNSVFIMSAVAALLLAVTVDCRSSYVGSLGGYAILPKVQPDPAVEEVQPPAPQPDPPVPSPAADNRDALLEITTPLVVPAVAVDFNSVPPQTFGPDIAPSVIDESIGITTTPATIEPQPTTVEVVSEQHDYHHEEKHEQEHKETHEEKHEEHKTIIHGGEEKHEEHGKHNEHEEKHEQHGKHEEKHGEHGKHEDDHKEHREHGIKHDSCEENTGDKKDGASVHGKHDKHGKHGKHGHGNDDEDDHEEHDHEDDEHDHEDDDHDHDKHSSGHDYDDDYDYVHFFLMHGAPSPPAYKPTAGNPLFLHRPSFAFQPASPFANFKPKSSYQPFPYSKFSGKYA